MIPQTELVICFCVAENRFCSFGCLLLLLVVIFLVRRRCGQEDSLVEILLVPTAMMILIRVAEVRHYCHPPSPYINPIHRLEEIPRSQKDGKLL